MRKYLYWSKNQNTYFLVEIWSLTNNCWAMCCNPVFDKRLIDQFNAVRVEFIVFENREVHSHRSIDLNLNKTGGYNLTAEIYNLVRNAKGIVKDFLRVDDDTLGRIDPKILVDKLPVYT